MLVEEVMTRNVEKIDCNENVYDACKIFIEKKVEIPLNFAIRTTVGASDAPDV